MDEQPITEGVAPSDNPSQEEMSDELKTNSTDSIKDSNVNISNSEVDSDAICQKLDNNSVDSVPNDLMPNSKHSPETKTESSDLEINNYEEKNNEVVESCESNVAAINDKCNEIPDASNEIPVKSYVENVAETNDKPNENRNDSNEIPDDSLGRDETPVEDTCTNEKLCEDSNESESKILDPEFKEEPNDTLTLNLENNESNVELNSDTSSDNAKIEGDLLDNNKQNAENLETYFESKNETMEDNNIKNAGENNMKELSDVQTEIKNDEVNDNQNFCVKKNALNIDNAMCPIECKNENEINDEFSSKTNEEGIAVSDKDVNNIEHENLEKSDKDDENGTTLASIDIDNSENIIDNNDIEDKKQTDDNEVSPDFECSDIKEHEPADEKQDSIEKSSNEEDKEEDPFDQVVNEAMDIDESSDKQNKESNSFYKPDESNDHDTTMDDLSEKETAEEMQVDSVSEETEEVQDVEASKGVDEEVCLLPDTEREISEADKERAILAKESLAKEAANKEAQDSITTFDNLIEGGDSNKPDEASMSNNAEKSIDGDEVVNDTATDDSKMEIQGDEPLKEHDDKDVENETIDITDTENDVTEPLKENTIKRTTISEQTCAQCSQITLCKFHMLVDGSVKFLCQKTCVLKYKKANDQYDIVVKKMIIKEVVGSEHSCTQCSLTKTCQYEILKEAAFLCDTNCLKKYRADEEFGNFVIRYRKVFVQEITPSDHQCFYCQETKKSKFQFSAHGEDMYVCDDECLTKLQEEYPDKYRVKVRKLFRVKEMPRLLNVSVRDINIGPKIRTRTEEAAEAAKQDRDKSFNRKCTMCEEIITGDEKNLSWETMDFCNEDCLSKYQNTSYSNCSNCKVGVHTTSLGKYCVRFGYDVRQFCSSSCLEEFKKGLKVCSYCQKDISGGSEGFLAPVGDKGQFKDFCTQMCMEKFDQMSKNCPPMNTVSQCAVCNKDKVIKVEVFIDGFDHKLCSVPCFSAFKFVNKIFPDQCDMCKKYYERKSSEHYTIYDDAAPHTFCSKTCMNVFILSNRQIVPCNWCKVKKYNYDMIRRNLSSGQKIMMCSLNCLTLYQVSVNAVSMRRIKCDHCKSLSQAQYHLTMSDATIRNFCTYQCVMSFQGQYSKNPITLGSEQHKTPPATSIKGAPVPTGAPKRTYNITRQTKGVGTKASAASKSFETPIISKVRSLGTPVNAHNTRGSVKSTHKQAQIVQQAPPPAPAPAPTPPPKPQFKTQLIVKPPRPKPISNMSTMCKPMTASKGTSCKQQTINKECQTDDSLQKRILIPVPVPIYVPTPLNMYSMPYPVPVPIPLPIPVPVFIPTTRNSANGIMKEIKKIHEKMPTDPFEAELLMMAEMVAGEKKRSESDSDSEDDAPEDDGFSPEGMETSNTFGEDMLQMALKMASEYDEPAVDLESAMTASTITPSSHPPMSNEEGVDDPNPMHHHHMLMMEQQRAAMRGRKRPNRPQGNNLGVNKRNRRVSNTDGLPMMQPPTQPEPPREPTEKPDANMCLKYTFGVNAWKQWVMTKNADLEKSSIRRKPFKSEILQLTADELNYSLCLFVKEVRKPNGSEYAPDTIYYLVLGIQQYLFENGRIDNIFTDAYYEKFTECLDEVAKKFSVLYNDSQYIVTRVEEEHLWESKQLGAHSPHVLLSTLMFFNTKHFNLVTVEEHMQLSFSHIMKHWKRNPNQPGATKVPGSRNVLLRFYPPQSALDANSRKKKVYEQQENEENPLRCPVKLYEFYLSKCPESVKTRNDVFYLLPERSCVPDSPVWYSTMALGKEPLQKMLHRVKMVKEINIALLTS